jgi:pilus assembly protein FimV
MKQWKQVSAVAAAAMALASGGAQALGLGVPNSRAILGESLRVSVPLELADGEDTDDGCPQAEVYYGDSRVDAGKVILGISPQTGRQRVLTVRAIQPINEPLIEVNLSYGCGAPLSRKFTIFANPPEFVPTVVLRPPTLSEQVGSAQVDGRDGGETSGSGTRVATASATGDAPAMPRAVQPVPVRRPAKVAAPRPKAPPPPAAPVPAPVPEPVVAPSPAPVPAAVPVPAPADKAASAAAPAPAPKASSVVLGKPSPAPKPAPVSRLMLDPVVPMAATMPGAGASGVASAVQPDLVTSQAGTDIERLQAQLAQDRQRLDEMEKLITQLRQDAAQAKAAASGVGLSRPAGLADGGHPAWLVIVSAVAGASLMLSAYLIWRLRRQEQARAWWSESER